MTWYNTGGTTTYEVTGVNSAELFAVGYPGYATQAQAAAKPYNANVAQNAAMAQIKAESDIVGGSQNAPAAIGSGVSSVSSGINAVGDFFNRLSEGNTWLRIAEATLGIVLIAIALGKITGVDNGIKTVAKVAAK
jgi:hypothetical protein